MKFCSSAANKDPEKTYKNVHEPVIDCGSEVIDKNKNEPLTPLLTNFSQIQFTPRTREAKFTQCLNFVQS